jgi:recombination protein RecA
MFGEGISSEGDILDLAAENNIINKSGAWYAYEGNKIGQGRENAKQYLKDNPVVCAEVERKVRELFNLEADDADVPVQDKKAEAAQDIKAEKAAKEAKAEK